MPVNASSSMATRLPLVWKKQRRSMFGTRMATMMLNPMVENPL